MRTFGRSVFLHCSKAASVTSRTAVYGPVRTVVWQGSAGDRRPYADLQRCVPVFVPRGVRQALSICREAFLLWAWRREA